MYLMNVEEANRCIEINLGGVITAGEVAVMVDDILDELSQNDYQGYELVLDTTFAKRLDAGISDEIDRARKYLTLHGLKLVIVTATAVQAESWTTHNLQAVLEGREEYRIAA